MSDGSADGRLVLLSRREREVLQLLGEHLTHEQIAQQLVLSVRTVESHVASLRRKLDLPEHRALVRFATTLALQPAHDRARPPVPLTPFIGRARDRERLLDACATSRLVTVVGAGGVGKTRLALSVAGQLGARWIDLVPIDDQVGLEEAVAGAIGAVPTGRRSSLEAAIATIGDTDRVLALDNAEHLSNQVAVVAEQLLASCSALRILVTSRVRLAVSFEAVVHVEGLRTGVEEDAVSLFAERVRAAGGPTVSEIDRAGVAAICEALGGLPLAIELAAVRVPAIGLSGVRRALTDQTRLLTGPARATVRHRSMSETLDWSIALLSPAAAAGLRRLALFTTEFDADSAAAVAGFAPLSPATMDSALGELVDHSLLSATTAGTPRTFRMLEPIRQHAYARLLTTDAPAHRNHLDWCNRRLGTATHTELGVLADETRAALGRVASGLVPAEPAAEVARRFALMLYRAGSLREAQARWEEAAAYEGDVERALRDLAAASAVAKCRVLGDEALRIDLAAAALGEARGNPVGAALALCRAAELLNRFPGMFGALPDRDPVALSDHARSLAPGDPGVQLALLIAGLGYANPQRATSDEVRAVVAQAGSSGDVVRESATRDALTSCYLESNVLDAHRAAQQRLELPLDWRDDPAAGLELKDALHVAAFTAIGAGDLQAAYGAARQLAELPFLRERRDLAEDELIAPAVLAGDFELAAEVADRFLADWTVAGRPPAAGRALMPSAMAAACGLTGDVAGRQRWLEVLAEMRGVPLRDAWRGNGHGELFEGLGLLHDGHYAQALAIVSAPVSGLYGAVFAQWLKALAAEAAVLLHLDDEQDWLDRARAAAAGNPVASAIVRRADLLRTRAGHALERLAAELAAAGWSYQAERTRRLAATHAEASA